MMSAAAELALRRGAEHLHELGPRALAEFLLELSTATGCEAELLDMLRIWRRLDPDHLGAVLHHYHAGREFPPLVQAVETAA
jgi:hypothetical protein